MNAAVSGELIILAKELQSLPSLRQSYLAGGTNLALRFEHRKSEDIDLFIEEQIGRDGFSEIKGELESHFQKRLIRILFPCDKDDPIYILKSIYYN